MPSQLRGLRLVDLHQREVGRSAARREEQHRAGSSRAIDQPVAATQNRAPASGSGESSVMPARRPTSRYSCAARARRARCPPGPRGTTQGVSTCPTSACVAPRASSRSTVRAGPGPSPTRDRGAGGSSSASAPHRDEPQRGDLVAVGGPQHTLARFRPGAGLPPERLGPPIPRARPDRRSRRRSRSTASSSRAAPPSARAATRSTPADRGGSGIRTHGDSRLNGFQDRPVRPLRHPSCQEA